MIDHVVRLSLFLSGLLSIAACSLTDDRPPARVTIDMRCGSSSDCPAGFQCEADAEHGPPTTMCQSSVPAATCPPGYETKAGHGQTFCTPYPGAGDRSGSITAHGAGPSERSWPRRQRSEQTLH